MMKSSMKKILPFVVLALGLGVASFVIWKIVGGKSQPPPIVEDVGEEEVVVELPMEQRPFLSLVPRVDGHEIKLKLERIPAGTPTAEYELEYKVADGRTMGVPGSVSLSGATTLERDLLLGSCSSGKCRFDEGVESGKVTIRLRDGKGKLIGRVMTEFKLLQGVSEVGLGEFLFSGKLDKKAFYMVYGALGLPADLPAGVSLVVGPDAVSSSVAGKESGKVSFGGDAVGEIYGWSGGGWKKLTGGQAKGLGVFILGSSGASVPVAE